jgi:hypothetical protein
VLDGSWFDRRTPRAAQDFYEAQANALIDEDAHVTISG